MSDSKVYGLNACLMFSKMRKEKIVRAFFTTQVAPQFSTLMKYLAKEKKVYRIVPAVELEKISQSKHHEGVCFVFDRDKSLSLKSWFESQKKTQTSCLLVLENVENPHNLGAIMRICAQFGVSAIAIHNSKGLQSGAAMRTAEGGAEFIVPIEYKNLDELFLLSKQNNYSIVSTSSHQGTSLYQYKFPSKTVLLFGEEKSGLTKQALKLGQVVKIPGTENIESLNVSTAIAVMLGEFWRQTQTQTKV